MDTKKSQFEQKQSPQDIVNQIGKTVRNSEVLHIVKQYLQSPYPTDIQRQLNSEQKRGRVVGALESISELADRSVVALLTHGAESIHSIAGTQAEVDALSDIMRESGSRLFDSAGFLAPDDPQYWKKEASFVDERKDSEDARWQAWDKTNPEHVEQTQDMLANAEQHHTAAKEWIAGIIAATGIANAEVSSRVKSAESLLNKVEKFRHTDWGKDATIADAVDIVGGRIVVDDLRSLESVMVGVEESAAAGGYTILRKENKFLANDKKPVPYRAIHYIIQFPGSDHTMELQLKTFSSMVASDLFHDAVYKADILSLPGELQDTVRQYNWASVKKEMEEYLGRSLESGEVEELTPEQRIDDAIARHDMSAVYDLLLKKLDPREKLSAQDGERLRKIHTDAANKIREWSRTGGARDFERIAGQSHDRYYVTMYREVISNPETEQLGGVLPKAAVQLLPEEAQQIYKERFLRFSGEDRRISVEDLQLHKLNAKHLREFFMHCHKDVRSQGTPVMDVIQAIEALSSDAPEHIDARRNIHVMNLFHMPASEIRRIGEGQDSPVQDEQSRREWLRIFYEKQIDTIATSTLLSEIHGIDSDGNDRDLSETIGVNGATRRNALLYLLNTAVHGFGRHGRGSFAEYVGDHSTVSARHFDDQLDTRVFHSVVLHQLVTEAKQINKYVRTPETSGVQIARLQSARYDLLQTYIQNMCPGNAARDVVIQAIEQKRQEQVAQLLDASTEQSARAEIQSNRRKREHLDIVDVAIRYPEELAHTLDQDPLPSDVSGDALLQLIADRVVEEKQAAVEYNTLLDITDPQELVNMIDGALAEAELDEVAVQQVQDAVTAGIQWHDGQKRAEGTPYILHPLRIVYQAIVHGERNPNALSAAVLHDAIEDNSQVNRDVVAQRFNEEVAEMCYTLSKLRDGVMMDEDAYFEDVAAAPLAVRRLKLLDRQDNLFSLNRQSDELRKVRYIKKTQKHFGAIVAGNDDLEILLNRAQRAVSLL